MTSGLHAEANNDVKLDVHRTTTRDAHQLSYTAGHPFEHVVLFTRTDFSRTVVTAGIGRVSVCCKFASRAGASNAQMRRFHHECVEQFFRTFQVTAARHECAAHAATQDDPLFNIPAK